MFTNILSSVSNFVSKAWDSFVTGLQSLRDAMFRFADRHPAITVLVVGLIGLIALFAPELLVAAIMAALAMVVVYAVAAVIGETVTLCYVAAGNTREEALEKTSKLFARLAAVINFIINTMKLVAAVKEATR